MATNIELYTRLNTELMSMVEQFTNLIKGTKEGLEADEVSQRGERGERGEAGGLRPSGDRRVPGELLEVLVEKLLTAGHQCVHTISELKQGAVISDFDKLTANILEVGNELHKDSYGISRGLDHISREAAGLLQRLEQHYYTSGHKGTGGQAPDGQPGTGSTVASLAELCAQAQAMMDDMHAQ